jgi:hypothetical protein
MGYAGGHENEMTPAVRDAISQLECSFRATPLDFTVESALVMELLSNLRASVGERIRARGGYLPGPPPGYKDNYLDRIVRPQRIRNVQPEVNIGYSSYFEEMPEPKEAKQSLDGLGNSRIDIGKLTPAEHYMFPKTEHEDYESTDRALQICFANGSKYYPHQSVTHAIEVKFIKDKSSPGTGLESDGAGGFEPTWSKIENDIRKLKLLREHGAEDGAECHLIIASNLNIFQTGVSEDAKNYNQDYRDRLKNLVEYCESGIENPPIHVWEIFPRAEERMENGES